MTEQTESPARMVRTEQTGRMVSALMYISRTQIQLTDGQISVLHLLKEPSTSAS